MNYRRIGSCSLCGGDVVTPEGWMSILPPKPTCRKCGATAKPSGPVIPMEAPVRPTIVTWTVSDRSDR